MRKPGLITECLNEIEVNYPDELLIIVETGTIRNTGDDWKIGDGHSTVEIAEWNKDRDGFFYSVDLNTDVCEKYLEELNLKDMVALIKEDSIEFLKRLKIYLPVHFAYLDSANDPDHCFKEFELVIKIMPKGAIILVDDCDPDANIVSKAQKVLQHCITNKLDYTIIENQLKIYV